MTDIARYIMILGIIIFIIGGIVFLAARHGSPLGKIPIGQLPGDVSIQRGNFTCFFPIATSIILSIVLTVILNLIIRFFNR